LRVGKKPLVGGCWGTGRDIIIGTAVVHGGEVKGWFLLMVLSHKVVFGQAFLLFNHGMLH